LAPLLVTLVIVGAAAAWIAREMLRAPPRLRRVPQTALRRDVVLSPDRREVPGETVTGLLFYRHPTATNVLVAGSWDRWTEFRPMSAGAGEWTLDVASLRLPFGRHEFKFLPNGQWEPGENRILYINDEGLVERPPDLILAARLEEPSRVDIYFRAGFPGGAPRPPERTPACRVRLVPPVPAARVEWIEGGGSRGLLGCSVSGDLVTFCLDEGLYGISIANTSRVSVAGSFNGWSPGDGRAPWLLTDPDDDGVWEGAFPLPVVGDVQFKFVVNGARWLEPPRDAPNAVPDGRGNRNLRVDPQRAQSPVLRVFTGQPLPLAETRAIVIEGLADRALYAVVTPGAALDRIRSDKPLGAVLDRAGGRTAYRLFAPRASRVDLCFYDGPERERSGAAGGPIAPAQVVPLHRDDADGVWEVSLPGLHAGRYYAFRAEGPEGPGEAFNARAVFADPYARAVAHARNNGIVVDPDATNEWFSGWTDGDYRPPAWRDAVLYEAHIRDLTISPSSGVPEPLRGRYEGLLASDRAGGPLDHLRRLGVNMIELLPVGEFENGEFEHGWGYATAFFFAPEASYARDPLRGSQYWELKRLVNELHRRGFGVILDVVYNHIGGPNPFLLVDRKYYFRQDPEFRFTNFSGCGNDTRTEAPMMRRLIVDNVLYWMKEFHVDGFRFDLAELIDMQTLMAVRDAARAANPNVLLISEPWSFRRDHKYDLTGTGWAAWNNEFRDAAKRFARGQGDPASLQRAIRGSVETWAANPLQSVNYLESHDDMCLADELASDAGHDGRKLGPDDAARNRLAATVLFTSLGIPMISEGQEFLRSKHGLFNTFAGGDAVNAIEWDDAARPAAAETLGYYRDLIRLREGVAGAAFRWGTEPVPADYCRWIQPPDGRALGFIANADGRHEGGAFVVLLNGSPADVRFEVAFPPGRWLLVGDGRRVDEKGSLGEEVRQAAGASPRTVAVPALSSRIYLRAGKP
jgi:pullulanase/glycogen debranching enzyme